MPSHVYIFDRTNVPDWEIGPAMPYAADAVSRQHAIADAIVAAVPGAVEEAWATDPDAHWISIHASPLTISVHIDHVHVRIPYWSAAELGRLGAQAKLEQVASAVFQAAGWDFVEHGDQGLGIEVGVATIIDAATECGDATAASLAKLLEQEGMEMPMRGSEQLVP